ncbi:fimbrial protein [Enterobacter roggenkampii]|uniref:fimbrial protein n=1 Tax=Enterobacter roggenkampii TaxID=1812935 RepID=UPI000DA1FFD5|nr:fimbrial protein [Enterobacter roggenkampii]
MNSKLSIVALLMTAPIFSCSADTVNINVTGNVVASPCIVNGGASSLNVDLGNIQATALAAAGSSSTAVPFTLTVTNCPTGTSTVKASIGGAASHDSPNLYMNSGTAGNVYVALYDGVTGNMLGPGSAVVKTVQSDSTASIALKANAYSLYGNTTPGSISSAITVTMTYQ